MEKWYKAFVVCFGLLAIASKAESVQKNRILLRTKTENFKDYYILQ